MPKVLNHLTLVGPLVQALRLELLLVNEEDAYTLFALLSKLTQLKVISLDIVRIGIAGLQANFPVQGPASVKAVTFRIHEYAAEGYLC